MKELLLREIYLSLTWVLCVQICEKVLNMKSKTPAFLRACNIMMLTSYSPPGCCLPLPASLHLCANVRPHCYGSLCSADSISSDEEEMRTLGSSGSESSTPDKAATAASIFTEQSNLVSKCKRFEQKYRMALEQKVASQCLEQVFLDK